MWTATAMKNTGVGEWRSSAERTVHGPRGWGTTARQRGEEVERGMGRGVRGTGRGEGRGVGKVAPVEEGRGQGALGHRWGCSRAWAEGGVQLGAAMCWKQGAMHMVGAIFFLKKKKF